MNRTQDATAYVIPAMDITDGQVIRNAQGVTSYIVQNVRWEDDRLKMDMMDWDDVAARLTLPKTGNLVTYLPAFMDNQPGLDPEWMRCLTCDSRHCGTVCSQPWLMDRA